MELFARGFQDLRSAIERRSLAADNSAQSPQRRGRGRGSTGGKELPPKAAASLALPFPDAWAAYCATNPRLRDPRLLPALVRRGVPDDLRMEVWSHCLGLEAACASARRAASGSPTSTAGSCSSDFGSVSTARECGSQATTCAEHAEVPEETTPVFREAAKETPEKVAPELDSPAAAKAVEVQPEVEDLKIESVNPETTKLLAADSPAVEPQAAAAEDEVPLPPKVAPEAAQESVPEATPEALLEGELPQEEAPPETQLHLPEVPEAMPTLPHGIRDLIEADVARTFPTCPEFQGIGGPAKLRKVLRSLAICDTELGYCQSLNFIAAVFIMVLREEQAALLAVQQLLVKLGTRTWYTEGMKQLRADSFVLEELLRERLPAVHGVLRAHKFDLLFIASKWFLCLFSTTLRGEALRRVWDAVLCDGIEAVFRVAFAILAQHSETILKTRSMDDLIHMFQEGLPDPSPEDLLRTAYDPALIGPLSRSELSQRRQQAVKRISTDDTRSEMRQTALRRGGVRPASILAR